MSDERKQLDRRSFMGGAMGAAAGVGAAVLLGNESKAQPPVGGPPPGGPPQDELRPSMRTPSTLYRLEADVRDCQVTGEIPSDLNGAFYRVGPDAQYPLAAGNIPFDGEGHASMFRIKDGRADFRSRFVRNERYLAQDEAGRILFPMYRNPYLNDPSVEGLSRSTANTHIINHRNMLLALKEDSPPSALDLLTLETIDGVYTFDDQLPSKTFTAHPKID
jgi:carotenoid cleavage dioxygenase